MSCIGNCVVYSYESEMSQKSTSYQKVYRLKVLSSRMVGFLKRVFIIEIYVHSLLIFLRVVICPLSLTLQMVGLSLYFPIDNESIKTEKPRIS